MDFAAVSYFPKFLFFRNKEKLLKNMRFRNNLGIEKEALLPSFFISYQLVGHKAFQQSFCLLPSCDVTEYKES